MKKLIAVAALLASGLAVPALPTAALAAPKDGCLIAPLLRAECREMIRDTTTTVAMAPAKAVADTAKKAKWPLLWWSCDPAPAGAKYMLTCN